MLRSYHFAVTAAITAVAAAGAVAYTLALLPWLARQAAAVEFARAGIEEAGALAQGINLRGSGSWFPPRFSDDEGWASD